MRPRVIKCGICDSLAVLRDRHYWCISCHATLVAPPERPATLTFQRNLSRLARRARRLGLLSTEIDILSHRDMPPRLEDVERLRVVARYIRSHKWSGGLYNEQRYRRTAAFLHERCADAMQRWLAAKT